MPVTIVVAAAAVASSLVLLVWAVTQARSWEKAGARNLLVANDGPVDLRSAVLQRSAQERVRPVVDWLVAAAKRLTPIGWIESLNRRITLCGNPPAWPLGRVLIAKLALGAGAFAWGFFAFAGQLTLLTLSLWVAMTALAYFAPDLVLYSRGQERQKTIGLELPNVLDQVTIAVEAGLGFDSALARTVRAGSGPLAAELNRALQEIQLGTTRSQALRNLSKRVESPDLRHFVAAVVQAESYGIAVADILRTQAAEQRTKRRQRAEEHAMKIPVKIVLPLILCVLPSLFVVLLGPAMIQISRTMFGTG